LVLLEDVKVPVENIMGKLNNGFKQIMWNFNHERWLINCFTVGGTRCIIEDMILWINQRKAFGKSLIKQPVIRAKLADAISQFEAASSWHEMITFQMNNVD